MYWCPFTHLRRTHGQGLVEYALVIALGAVVGIGALLLLGGQIQNVFGNVNSSL